MEICNAQWFLLCVTPEFFRQERETLHKLFDDGQVCVCVGGCQYASKWSQNQTGIPSSKLKRQPG